MEHNQYALKLAPLLAQYLYTHKRLDLPGIGSFILDPSVTAQAEHTREGKPVNVEGVSFENNTTVRESPDLVSYIASQTGKIKALAAADLASHLELAKQFLNIGKPFLFEGIGNLAKIKSGLFTFTGGVIMPESIKAFPAKDISATSSEESAADYKSIFYRGKEKLNWRKPAAFLLLLSGIGLAIWGGYTMYKKTTAKNNETAANEYKEAPLPVVSTDTVLYQKDSVIEITAPVVPAVPAGNYKFVLEQAPAKRAFDRFERLRTFQWDVKMETSDSLSYKLFMLLPGSAADTTKMLDSLTRLNGRRVYIE